MTNNNLYKNLETQFNKVFRHLKVGSFKTRERYAKAFKRFMVYLAKEYQSDARQWGYIEAERWNAFYNWLNENNLVTNKLEANIGFSNDYLPKK